MDTMKQQTAAAAVAAGEAHAANGQPSSRAEDWSKHHRNIFSLVGVQSDHSRLNATSGGAADRRALPQSCAGHKVELRDKVEWSQVKLEFRNKLNQFKFKMPRNSKGTTPSSEVPGFRC